MQGLAEFRRTLTGEFASLQTQQRSAKTKVEYSAVTLKYDKLVAKVYALQGKYYPYPYYVYIHGQKVESHGIMGLAGYLKYHSRYSERAPSAQVQRFIKATQELESLTLPQGPDYKPEDINRIQRVLDKCYEVIGLYQAVVGSR
jgi:hypothetical protein